ncbi:MAG: hypothetical protein JOZ51_01875, partial [Chloroflexi bacterium]|nr:hypothetical protein [Chloroflexota bacterium]
YVTPGLALLKLWPDNALTWPERLSLAIGISIGLSPLLLQTAYLIGLPWNGWTTWAYVLLALGVLLAPYRHNPRQQLAALNLPPTISSHTLMLGGLLSVALLTRLFVIRDLPVGMWGDSYHHTMIAQLLVEQRGLFTSWEPYAPLVTFTYHYGFHANAAFLHWFSGISIPKSVLYTGQLHNFATLTSAYLLTTRLTKSRQAGLWAVALTGFANIMPAFYVNWGRYTQLTGQVALPAVVICWMALLEHDRLSKGRIVLAAIVTASLMLTHYIVTIFAALFVAAYVLALLLRTPTWPALRATLARSIPAAGLALIVAAPWLWNTLGGNLSRNVAGFVNQSVSRERISSISALESVVPDYIHPAILLLALLGFGLALARRNWRIGLCVAWSVLLVLVVVPYVFGLPGAGVIAAFTSYIALYISVIPLAAYLLGFISERLSAWRPFVGALVGIGALIGVSLWGVRWQEQLIETQYQLFTPADDLAMEWIRESTPPDARFLVNMFPAYGDSLVVGSDGGWWIPLLTQRQTTLPPITYGSERAATTGFAKQINSFAKSLRDNPLPSDEGLALCRAAGIRYIYSGAHSEQIDKFDVEELRESPALNVVYEEDGVVIFEILP